MPNTRAEERIQRWKGVLKLHKQGKTYREIALALNISDDVAWKCVDQVRRAKDPDEFVRARITNLTPRPVQVPKPSERTMASEVKRQQEEAERRFKETVYRSLLGEKARTEQIISAIERTITRLPNATIPILKAPTTSNTPQTALLMFSDLHIGSVVKAAETGGMGEYNYNIFAQRLDGLRDTVRSIANHHRQSHPVHNLVVAALGDNVEGETIFPSQRLGIDMDVLAQSFKAVEDIASFLVSLLDTFETIEFCGVVGNHGRIGRKGDTKTYVNWDHVIYRALALKFEGTEHAERITFEIPESFWIDKVIEGHSFMFRHGDGIKSWAGIPWYGINRSVSRWIALANARNRRFEYMCMGHFHQKAEIEIPAGEVFVNGSFVGASEFSVEVMEQISAASQLLMMVHPKYGVAARYPVLLDRQ